MAEFTTTQGRYLEFIQAYTNLHRLPPAESEIAAALCVSAPSVNQMVKTHEKKGLISRQPGQPRSIRVLVPEDEIPALNGRPKKSSKPKKPEKHASREVGLPAKLYVLLVFLKSGPVSKKFAARVISRMIENRGDQTLEQLHEVIFKAYGRWDERRYEFRCGKRPFDPEGPNYGVPVPGQRCNREGDASKTILDDLGLEPERVFGYLFDFGDNWFHQVQVERVEQAIPTVIYPRIIKQVGKSPPQYSDES